MTKQQILDKVVSHLQEQKGTSFEHGECRYRTDDGEACAVGCLIAEEDYDSRFESCGIDPDFEHPTKTPLLLQALRNSGVSTDADTIAFLHALQNIHDNQRLENRPTVLMNRWKKEFTELANEHNLQLNWKESNELETT